MSTAVSLYPPNHDPTPSISERVREAATLRAQGKVVQALRALTEILKVAPRHAYALIELGYCYLRLREYDNALQQFRDALETEPREGSALYGAAVSLFELGRLDEATSYATLQTQLPGRDNQANGLYLLGLIAHARGAWSEAIPNLEESLALRPHRSRPRGRVGATELRHHNLLAECYQEIGRPEEAVRHLEWVRRAVNRPTHAEHLQLAALLLELRRFPDARREIDAVLAKTPEDREALLLLGRYWSRTLQHAEAIRVYKRLLTTDRQDPDALTGMIEAHKARGELEEALGYIKQIEQTARRPEVRYLQRERARERERVRQDAELLRARNIAALNVMATGIAHELRQPLSVIRLAASNARKDLARGDIRHTTDDLADIDANVDRLNRIIEILRNISHGDGDFRERVSVRDALDDAMQLFQTQLSLRGIVLQNRVDEGLWVAGNRAALTQIFMNLISNARDALADAEQKRICVDAERREDRVFILVGDSGCGMVPATVDRVMDPFFTTKGTEGTGLGLYLSQNFAQKMGGFLRVASTEPGRGTTFELVLPVAPEPEGTR